MFGGSIWQEMSAEEKALLAEIGIFGSTTVQDSSLIIGLNLLKRLKKLEEKVEKIQSKEKG